METGKKRIAVVGYGGMGGWHVKHILKSDVLELAGICDIRDCRKEKAREREIYVYETFEDVLADPTVDLLTLAVPNELHMPMAVKAMEAGKNVISEKPVALNSTELQAMIDASNRTGKLFTVHQNRRWDCDYLKMKEVYASGELGDVFGIESRVQGSRGIPGDWRGHKEHGGGMILDWGVHLIDQMLGIVYDRKVEKVYCRCDHITNYEVDDGFKLDLYFENDLTARIEVGTSHFIALPRYYMTGSNGSAIIENWTSDCRVTCCKNWDEKDVVPVVTAAGLTKTMAPRDENTIMTEVTPLPTSDVHDFYRNVCRAIDGKEEQIVKHDQLMRVMKIMEAAFRSDELGAPVAIDDKIC
ncbi:MAG: Gfo/Idh/MocA family oxidoreductase [Clostridia bacterium]|nr:Gfo/Idh/MocA family oxidoreductase [Clostridia bacterium]